jgi:hypothetical protein
VEALKIVGLTVAAAVLYGILHDQVTARVCVEYFTRGHPPIFGGLESPTLLGLAWGVIATWWAGACVGVPLAIASRVGPWPQLAARDLVKPLLMLFLVMGICAGTAGAVGWHRAERDIELRRSVAEVAPPNHQVAFVAAWFAHSASYFVGFAGGAVLWCIVLIQRWTRRAGRPTMD